MLAASMILTLVWEIWTDYESTKLDFGTRPVIEIPNRWNGWSKLNYGYAVLTDEDLHLFIFISCSYAFRPLEK